MSSDFLDTLRVLINDFIENRNKSELSDSEILVEQARKSDEYSEKNEKNSKIDKIEQSVPLISTDVIKGFMNIFAAVGNESIKKNDLPPYTD